LDHKNILSAFSAVNLILKGRIEIQKPNAVKAASGNTVGPQLPGEEGPELFAIVPLITQVTFQKIAHKIGIQ